MLLVALTPFCILALFRIHLQRHLRLLPPLRSGPPIQLRRIHHSQDCLAPFRQGWTTTAAHGRVCPDDQAEHQPRLTVILSIFSTLFAFLQVENL